MGEDVVNWMRVRLVWPDGGAAKIALRCAEAVRHCTDRGEYKKKTKKKDL